MDKKEDHRIDPQLSWGLLKKFSHERKIELGWSTFFLQRLKALLDDITLPTTTQSACMIQYIPKYYCRVTEEQQTRKKNLYLLIGHCEEVKKSSTSSIKDSTEALGQMRASLFSLKCSLKMMMLIRTGTRAQAHAKAPNDLRK